MTTTRFLTPLSNDPDRARIDPNGPRHLESTSHVQPDASRYTLSATPALLAGRRRSDVGGRLLTRGRSELHRAKSVAAVPRTDASASAVELRGF